jgi:hypothetical protein
MTPAQGASPGPVADNLDKATEQYPYTRKRGGRAAGGKLIAGYHVCELQRCECCNCRIRRGTLVYEVLIEDTVLEVCAECVGSQT